MPEPQSFKNHTRRDLPYLFAVLIFFLNCVTALVITIRIAISHQPHHLGHHLWLCVVSVALLVAFATTRVKDLRVQNRVIRLEERVRYAAILQPADQAVAAKLTLNQIIALRFASDTEFPALMHRAINENLTSKQIKESITTWRADDLRV